MNEEFKDRLKALRERRQLSQADVAERSGLMPAAISHFETGKRSPSFDNLRKIADALDVSVDYLLGRIDEEQYGMGSVSAPRSRELFRNAENLSDSSLNFLNEMAKALSEKEKKDSK
ncbi:helix-turn-helix transcriptional regulator [Ruficoccus amylovorans]|uniref:Helix-turn-helix transcriptional regulator n=1 Tax=Ruficoccus amylovorans TaxID=1804625 RepID=A0A842HBQ7_9BACT|nr:helix-turn-helix transcriptional regulator [Ruficoccus amylovorans]MBC2592861.1 helix-turn-helix transcriptional regulator [Ruficoccus amylovorans]